MRSDHHTVVATVRRQTDPDAGKPPTITRLNITGDEQLRQQVDDERIDECLEDLVRQGTVLRWTDEFVDPPLVRYTVADPDRLDCWDRRLQEQIVDEVESPDTDTSWIGELNRLRDELQQRRDALRAQAEGVA
jgi:hypothetical protein